MIEVLYYGRPVGKVRPFLWRDGHRFLCRLQRVVIGRESIKPYYAALLSVQPFAGGALVSILELDIILRRSKPYVSVEIKAWPKTEDAA